MKGDRKLPGDVRKRREFPGKGNSKAKGSEVVAFMAGTKRKIHKRGGKR